jgi:N-acetylmuramoyl-L-alanine amidase
MILLVAFVTGASSSWAWELMNRNGIEYVSLADVRSFYGLSSESREGNAYVYRSKSVQMKLRPRSQDVYLNNVKFILSYPIAEDVSKGLLISQTDITKLVDPILRPRYIQNAHAVDTVVIDPGHGGHDAGTRNRISMEKDLTLQVARRLKDNLAKKGFKVVMTRDSDVYLTLQERVNIANKYKNAVFVCIHFNDGGPAANGIETFTLAPAGTSSTMSRNINPNMLQGNAQDSSNIALATAIQGQLIRGPLSASAGMQPFDRGIKRARFSVLCTIKHPAVLVECGFLSNQKEALLAKSDSYQNFLVQSISMGIEKYRRSIRRR